MPSSFQKKTNRRLSHDHANPFNSVPINQGNEYKRSMMRRLVSCASTGAENTGKIARQKANGPSFDFISYLRFSIIQDLAEVLVALVVEKLVELEEVSFGVEAYESMNEALFDFIEWLAHVDTTVG